MSAGNEEFYKEIMDLVMVRIKGVDFTRTPEAVDPLIQALVHSAAHLCLVGGVDLPTFVASCVAEAQEAANCVAAAMQNTPISKELSSDLEDMLKNITTPAGPKDPGDDGLKN